MSTSYNLYIGPYFEIKNYNMNDYDKVRDLILNEFKESLFDCSQHKNITRLIPNHNRNNPREMLISPEEDITEYPYFNQLDIVVEKTWLFTSFNKEYEAIKKLFTQELTVQWGILRVIM